MRLRNVGPAQSKKAIKLDPNNSKRILLQTEQPKPTNPKTLPIPAFLVVQWGARIPKNRPIISD